MALTELWKTANKELQEKQVQQVIAFAGDGKLRDGGVASKEFREFLAAVPSSFLSRYAGDCLAEKKFDGSGLALQDVINEVGTRLGFKVEKGRYRGTPGEIGFDGLWISPGGDAIVVEVKTTDAYRIDLETIATYRRNIIGGGKAKEPNCSILIIVGRSDTGDLEAQVRGSRHAWDIRLISIDGLLRLMHLKEELDDPKIMEKIRRLLTPQEFTKVDGIIDLVFSTAEDVKKDEVTEVADDDDDDQKKPKFIPINFRDACAARVQKFLGQPLVKRSLAVYSSPDENLALVCINSREYKKPNGSGFWFAFHPHQRDLLQNHKRTFVALGCGSEESILLIPGATFVGWLERFHITELEEGRFYWHVRVDKDKQGFLLRVKKGADAVKLNEYLLKV